MIPARKSAIYFGTARHRRFAPKVRHFSHRVCYFYLDLAEIPSLFRYPLLFSDRKPSLFGFRRRDYFGGKNPETAELSLDEGLRRKVESASGRRPTGPIRILTQITAFGFSFNPVSFYYFFDEQERLETIMAEITNTPWGERHSYVLDARAGEAGTKVFEFEKAFHVSPFLGMDYRYRWAYSPPGKSLVVHMENRDLVGDASVTFDATLSLARKEWSGVNLFTALISNPWMSLKTVLLIYGHAAVIWLRGVPVHTHPRKRGITHPDPKGNLTYPAIRTSQVGDSR